MTNNYKHIAVSGYYGFENFGDDVVLIVDGGVVQFDRQRRVGFEKASGNAFSHAARRIPHRIINDGDLVFLIFLGPFLIRFDDLQGIVPPDDAVAGANHIDRNVHL